MPDWKPSGDLPERALGFRVQEYGMTHHADLFTSRQLLALTTFSDLVMESARRITVDASGHDLTDDFVKSYAESIKTYLAFAVSKAADRNTSLCSWENRMNRMRNTFGRQALPMVWDYAETNPLAGAGGDIAGTAFSIFEVVRNLEFLQGGKVMNQDATQFTANRLLISTDPPYYDNIGYVDLPPQSPSSALPYVRLCLRREHEENRLARRNKRTSRPGG